MAALPAELTEKMDGLRAICAKYGVKSLRLFGSAARGEFDPATSDFDFIVEFLPDTGHGIRFFSFGVELEDLLGRKVDVLERGPIQNPYLRKHIEANPTLPVYEAA